jgi:hypothetical protein
MPLIVASAGKVEKSRRFARETPKDRRVSKTDLAKYLNAWSGAPHLISYGSQKNFQYFMQSMKDEYLDGFLPDEAWFRAFVAKTILFRSVQKIAKSQKFPAYQANIKAYWLGRTLPSIGSGFGRSNDGRPTLYKCAHSPKGVRAVFLSQAPASRYGRQHLVPPQPFVDNANGLQALAI